MSYVPLNLTCADKRVAGTIAMATERHLEQAHYLLAATYTNGAPSNTFGTSAAIMTLLSIAAASAIRHFIPKANKNTKKDAASFVACVETHFPWDDIGILDGEHRPARDLPSIAAKELYSVFRNPLVHSGGVIGKGHLHRSPAIMHPFPGFSAAENARRISDLCWLESFQGQVLLEIQAERAIVHTHPLYWCTRKMIEAFAADSSVEADIKKNMGY